MRSKTLLTVPTICFVALVDFSAACTSANAQRGTYPRRALVISVNDCLLLNPLHPGENRSARFPGSGVSEVAFWLKHFRMKFPASQVYTLSEATPKNVWPRKDVVEQTIAKFLKASRAQDRIIMLFTGHVVEGQNESYLVPIAGDPENAKTLIPLGWVYQQLQACKARQKTFILDVCRYAPARGTLRPGSVPMGNVLEKQLKKPPAGVEVWASCSVGQLSYEGAKGSLFLEALCAAMRNRSDKIQTRFDSIPLARLKKSVDGYLAKKLNGSTWKQTTLLAGRERLGGPAFNPNSPLPPRLVISIPPAQKEEAKAALLREILAEINAVPLPRAQPRKGFGQLSAAALPGFSANVLKPYGKDGYQNEREFMEKQEQFPLRHAVVRAKIALQANAKRFVMREVFQGNTGAEAVVKAIQKELTKPGRCLFRLEEILEDLVKAKKHLKTEKSKRWRAHYDLVMARVKARLIYVLEYATVMAKIRRGKLVPLQIGETGYRLASTRRLASREVKTRQWRRDLRTLWDKMLRDYPNTPWALLARRERVTSLGLEGRPIWAD